MQLMPKGKKGQTLSISNNLLVIGVLIIVVAGFVGVLGATLNVELGDSFVTGTSVANTSIGCNATARQDCGFAYNMTVQTNEGVENVTEQLDLTGTVIVMGFLLGLIFLVIGVVASR